MRHGQLIVLSLPGVIYYVSNTSIVTVSVDGCGGAWRGVEGKRPELLRKYRSITQADAHLSPLWQRHIT
jgi:hypothetical protein